MGNKMDKTVILLALVLFTFSNSLWDIIWNIGKSLIYLIIFIFCINLVNTSLAMSIKSMINDLLNIGSNNFIKDTTSSIAKSTMNLIKSSVTNNKVAYTSANNNRSLMSTNNTNNRKLM
jgi:hypothetical protein